MAPLSDFHDPAELRLRRGRFVGDLRRLFVFHGLRCGSPADLGTAAAALDRNGPLRTDTAALLRSTRDLEPHLLSIDMLRIMLAAMCGDDMELSPAPDPLTRSSLEVLDRLLTEVGGWARPAIQRRDSWPGAPLPEPLADPHGPTPPSSEPTRPPAEDVRAFVRKDDAPAAPRRLRREPLSEVVRPHAAEAESVDVPSPPHLAEASVPPQPTTAQPTREQQLEQVIRGLSLQIEQMERRLAHLAPSSTAAPLPSAASEAPSRQTAPEPTATVAHDAPQPRVRETPLPFPVPAADPPSFPPHRSPSVATSAHLPGRLPGIAIAAALVLAVGIAAAVQLRHRSPPSGQASIPAATAPSAHPPTSHIPVQQTPPATSSPSPAAESALPAEPAADKPEPTPVRIPRPSPARIPSPAKAPPPDRVAGKRSALPVKTPRIEVLPQPRTPRPAAETAVAGRTPYPMPAPATPSDTAETPGTEAALHPHTPVVVPESTMDQQILTTRKPVYPAAAAQQHVEGTVVLNALVDTDGTVRRMDVVAGPPALVNSAIAAASWRRYRPYLVHGKPVEVRTRITVHYAAP